MPFSKDRLIALLDAKGWNAADLARVSEVNEGDISRYLRGKRRPRDVAPLAKGLEATSDYLLDNDDRFSGYENPGQVAAAVMSLECYLSDSRCAIEEELELERLALTLKDPPVTSREWRRVHAVLRVRTTGVSSSPANRIVKRPRGGRVVRSTEHRDSGRDNPTTPSRYHQRKS
jgi:transcriptional regulator with XRE-family HTH domain